MNTNQKKMLYRIAIESFLIPLLYVGLTYGIIFGLLVLAGLRSDLVHIGYLVGLVLLGTTIIFWLLFQKTLMKQLIKSRMRTCSEKAQHKDNEIFALLDEDLEDATNNSVKLALDKPRGNWQDRYRKRDERLALLYEQSAKYDNKELRLAELLNYIK